MENNFVYILTEGDHDASFIYRILKSNGFSTYSKSIKDFPNPLNYFLQSDIKNVSIPEVRIQEARSRFLPAEVLKKDNNLVLIYSLGGDAKDALRISLVKAINTFNVQDPEAIQASPNSTTSVLYFFDADEIGTIKRMEQVTNELKQVFTKLEFDTPIKELEIIQCEDISLGAFIFKEKDMDKGMLEDVLIPLMKQDNEDIFDVAEKIITMHPSTNLFKDVLTYDASNTILKKVNGIKFAHKKSLVGTVGQLQKSGKSNTICIRETDYLNDVKILNSITCQNIYEFINKVVK